MPRLKKFELGALSNPALNDKIIEFVEREAKELADVGISILADAVKRRLFRARSPRAPTVSAQDWNGRAHPASTPTATSPYEVLGVSPEASDDEVEGAFRRQVHIHHPDKGGDEDAFRRVLAAIHQIRFERKP